jgi:hypothetical protein
MVPTRGRFPVLGGNPLHGSDALDSRMGACLWDLSLGQHTGDGKLDGETFLGRTWMFFSRGGGGGEEELQDTTDETFSQDDASSKQPCLCYILYISQWGFRCPCLQAITKGVHDPRLTWTDTCAVRLRQPVDLVHALKTVKGLLHLVYVCYMLLYVICLVYVICLLYV